MSPSMPPSPPIASPFPRTAQLLSGIEPGRPPIDLTIGEPRHPVPAFVQPILAAETAAFGRYPPIRGSQPFREAVAGWLERRYGLGTPIDRARGVIPLNGSREGLFSAAVEAVRRHHGRSGAPVVLIPNPFYPVYAAGAAAAGAEVVLLDAGPETGFLPDLSKVPATTLARTAALFYASPANPQGAVASIEHWQTLIRAARQHSFTLFADECYSEIWRGVPPAGVLEAADRMGEGYGRVVAFNSLSKRSNLPGLRCGFAAGDPDFIDRWADFRNVAAPQVPLPVQAVAVAAYGDEAHVAENRALYDAKFDLARTHVGDRLAFEVPAGGFFLWLDVSAFGGGEIFARELWARVGVKAIPGGYLAVSGPDGRNPGAGFLRLAMVESIEKTGEAMTRLAEVLS